jgi:3-dehydroquinate dehydratase/shikimate dehydrogenase
VGPSLDEARSDLRAAREAGADGVELRLDLFDPLCSREDLAALLAQARDLTTIVTCRPAREGGRYDGDESARLDVLRLALDEGADYIDVEADVPPGHTPVGRIILSEHEFTGPPDDPAGRLGELSARCPAVAKLAYLARGPHDALTALDAVRNASGPAIVLAMGEGGLASRVLARKVGAFGTFAAPARGRESAPGQPDLAEFSDLYRWDRIHAQTPVFGVIGFPVAHSQSPAIHNAALAHCGLDGVYLPLLVEPQREAFDALLDGIRARPWLHWRGLSVTLPHKTHALEYVGEDACDPLAVRIGAVNTITFEPDGSLRGDNTDYAAAIDSLCATMGIERAGLAGRAVGVLGAGGAARAVVAALAHYGAETTVYNRTVSRAEALAEEFGAHAEPLALAESTEAEVLVNCTPLGMHPHADASPIEQIPPPVRVVFETIYNPARTRLLELATRAGCTIVTGLEMFVQQGAAQFERWTHLPAPREVIAEVLRRGLGLAPDR